MANSADVVAGNDATAAQYNNLRADVLNTSTGHLHDGTNGRLHTSFRVTPSTNVSNGALYIVNTLNGNEALKIQTAHASTSSPQVYVSINHAGSTGANNIYLYSIANNVMLKLEQYGDGGYFAEFNSSIGSGMPLDNRSTAGATGLWLKIKTNGATCYLRTYAAPS